MSPRILIPVNNQESAIAAMECAMARTWPIGTSFLLCTVIENLTNIPKGTSLEHREVLLAEQEAHAQEMKDWLKQANALFTQVFPDAQALVDSGNIPEQICKLAKDWAADYILIGSHSLGLNNKLALHGVAAQVMAQAHCTVEAVRPKAMRDALLAKQKISPEEIREAASKPPRKVLVASDLSSHGAAAVDWVAEQSWPSDCVVRIITVALTTPKESNLGITEKARSYTQEQVFLKRLENELRVQAKRIVGKQPDLQLESFLVQADSAFDGIAEQAEDWGADLVITGAQGDSHSQESRAGSTAFQVMDSISCSMIAVKQSSNATHFSWLNTATPN